MRTTCSLLLLAQTLHAFSFGAFHAVAIHLIHAFFPAHCRGQRPGPVQQSDLWRGNALGSLVAGYLWCRDWGRWRFSIWQRRWVRWPGWWRGAVCGCESGDLVRSPVAGSDSDLAGLLGDEGSLGRQFQ